jgi:hypothetical protein
MVSLSLFFRWRLRCSEGARYLPGTHDVRTQRTPVRASSSVHLCGSRPRATGICGRSVLGLGAPNCVFVGQMFESLGQEPTALLRFRDEVR